MTRRREILCLVLTAIGLGITLDQWRLLRMPRRPQPKIGPVYLTCEGKSCQGTPPLADAWWIGR